MSAAGRISDLPIEEVIDDLLSDLRVHQQAVLVAEPGAGKTTVVPLYLLRELPADKKILMLEPRRVAARAAARRLADQLGESVGDTVGYVTRTSKAVSDRSRLIVMTEGVLLRRLMSDPSLSDTHIVIFDEFHERSLDADMGLAMVRSARRYFRPDLHILVMSATIDASVVAAYLAHGAEDPIDAVPVISAPGRTFPIDIKWSPPQTKERLEQTVIRAIKRGLSEPGDLLVFLPGVGEIRRIASALEAESDRDGSSLDIRQIYGAMSAVDQDIALWGAASGRRVVLATNVAETSVTVEGIGVVIDSGVSRSMRFDAGRGLSRLKLGPISRASADQRAGRAGRTGPGVAIRCWSKVEHGARKRFTPPEIENSDLAGARLTLAAWAAASGIADTELLTPPPAKLLAASEELLVHIGAMTDDRAITPLGSRIADVPLHPRLARMVLDANERGEGWLACVVAALLTERDVLRSGGNDVPSDLRLRVQLVVDPTERHPMLDIAALRSVREQADDLAARLRIATGSVDLEQTGPLIADAFPERIATARGSVGKFALEQTSAWLPKDDALRFSPILAVAEADPRKKDRRIRLAAPLI